MTHAMKLKDHGKEERNPISFHSFFVEEKTSQLEKKTTDQNSDYL